MTLRSRLIVALVALVIVAQAGFFVATYTLYRTLPPPPVGPRFCPLADTGKYGLAGPCNFMPPFVWWLERHS